MDQLQTESSRLFGPQDPSDLLAGVLGTLIRAPVRDIPTVEDWQQEQGYAGVPGESAQDLDVGRTVLQHLAQAFGITQLMRGGGSAAQELMGKRRGQETFGKEMMDTSRRAQPQKWREMREEDLAPVERPMRSGYGSSLPPGETPTWRAHEMKPADVVEKGAWKSRLGDVDAYRIGTPVELPGGQQAQYLVIQSGAGASVVMDAGTRRRVVFTTQSMGEALAKARQLQNRLALAAKDPELAYAARENKLTGADRQIRMPWERGGITDWRSDYYPPPTSGRWSGEQ